MGYETWDELAAGRPRPRRGWPRSLGLLMAVVALVALGLRAVVTDPGGGPPRPGPTPFRLGSLVVPGAPRVADQPGIDDRMVMTAPEGTDDRMVMTAPEGIDDDMVLLANVVARRATQRPTPRLPRLPRRP